MKKLFLTSFVFTTGMSLEQCLDKEAKIIHGDNMTFENVPPFFREKILKEAAELYASQDKTVHEQLRIVVATSLEAAYPAAQKWFPENFPESKLISLVIHPEID